MAFLVALLPMKGHSERVPGKNLRPIAGKPLYHWVTEALLGAAAVDQVVVDTDSAVIADHVTAAFPEVTIHERPEHLWGDLVPMHDIVAFLASAFDGDDFLQTHATNPLLTSATIDAAVAAYRNSDAHDSLMSVTPVQTRFYRRDGSAVNHNPDELLRTQDLEPLLEENSNIYIAPRQVIIGSGRRIGTRPLLFEMAAEEARDIDVELDFLLAEQLLTMRHG